MKSLKDLLPQVNQATEQTAPTRSYRARAHSTFDFLDLIRSWPEVVGPTLAAHTIPLKNTRKVLTILTNHSAFSEQLKFMEKVIIEKIEAHFSELRGQVTELRFIYNSSHFSNQKKLVAKNESAPSAVPTQKAKARALPHSQSPEYRRLRSEAIKIFEDGPEELKESFISLYIQSKYNPNS